MKYFASLAKHGVIVNVLTSSQEATDVAAVHAGYAKRRKPLLRAGVSLFEMKGAPGAPRERHTGGSSSGASSLHAKTIAVDRARVFVGSFNFDPRSARLNTELGLVIESPAMASALAIAFTDSIPARAYAVRLGIGDRLEWSERRDDTEVVRHQEPGTSAWQRLQVWILSLLPIDRLL